MAIGANNLLMLALSNYRRKLFDLQTFQNQAHIISVTGIIIYFLGTYYLYTLEVPRGRDGLCGHHGGRSLASLVISAICRVWVKIEIRTRERIQRAADRRKVMGQ